MDMPQDTNNAPKRRRLDKEAEPRPSETSNLALAVGYRAPVAAQQLHYVSASQWASTASQQDALPTRGVNPAMFSHLYHSFPSQDATGSLIQDDDYQLVAANQQQLSTASASSSLNVWSSASVGHPMPQEPAQYYPQILPAPLLQTYPVAPTQVSFGSQSWQGVNCAEPQFPHANTTLAFNNVMPTASPPVQETIEGDYMDTVPSISARCDPKRSINLPSAAFSVQISSSTEFKSNGGPNISGHIFSEHGQMIQGLLDEETLDLYVSCIIQDSQGSTSQKTRSVPLRCTLEITVYGPLELFGEIGTWFDDYQVYLQDPREHQKQALTFMLRREQGWAFGQRPDVWEMIDTDQGRTFLNRISNAYQSEEPPQCYGGIIADPMGLGKTLTMIALAATDLERDDTEMDTSEDGQLNVSATLIVVPPPLIGTWEEQLSEHVVRGGMAWHRHHREARLSSTNELDHFNIVLTTYHTVSAEWNNGNGVRSSTLFSVRWERIILDEAHLIRNANSKMSQAVCALKSRSRWAVTGTPIQNRLGDLATLFKFIRAHPYTDQRRFDVDISRLWKAGEYEEAIKKAQASLGLHATQATQGNCQPP
ncbi:hypothetical protein CEP52_008933 [Fusarium oligoseptatum]|uniref:Helicase ATP-binding domain-containing protein n=1 Tax=Fusarium oligoseptatum TaxID=2604345 RepID=A0A428TFL2_9HYPO|nr:hypothetical protein CEP52_008933 [Fusarium oligoseptatum]